MKRAKNPDSLCVNCTSQYSGSGPNLVGKVSVDSKKNTTAFPDSSNVNRKK